MRLKNQKKASNKLEKLEKKKLKKKKQKLAAKSPPDVVEANVEDQPIKKPQIEAPAKRKKSKNKFKTADTASTSADDRLVVLKYVIAPTLTERQLFIKQIPREEAAINVANVPSLLDLETISAMIAHVAQAQPITCEIQRTSAANGDLQQGHRILRMTFESPTNVITLLNRVNIGTLCAADFGKPKLQSVYSELCDEYRKQFVSIEEMQQGVDEYVKQYEDRIAEERRVARLGRSQPDEEGWITVTAASKKMARAIKLKAGQNTIMGSLKNQGKKKEPSVPFYSFQIKQSKLQKMEDLRNKFEEDKRKIASAKAARKFKPL